jgi:isopenicillin N synthase-like dioxygenase
MHFYTPPKVPTFIPIVDLAGTQDAKSPARDSAAEAIHRACRETGFFYIANHGTDQQLIDDQFALAKAFFDLPLQDKMQLAMRKNPAAVGYEPIGGQKLDSQDPTKEAAPPDLKESFNWGADVPADHPYAIAGYRGYGTNHAPALAGFRAQMDAYATEMRRLGNLLLELIALSLDLPDNWFKPFFTSNGGKLRIIKYPPQPNEAQRNQIGAGAHTDWGGVTLLAQDQIGGLEVRNVAGDWIQAPPVAGTFVVNIGDLMARWTNGIYNSNLHRVKNNNSAQDRYSIPFFYDADPRATIEAIPTCVTPENPVKYAICSSNEHMADMFQRSYGFRPGQDRSSQAKAS